jgi:hypothetical protein
VCAHLASSELAAWLVQCWVFTQWYPAWSAPTMTQNTTANNGMLMPMSSLRPGPSRACFSVAAVLRVATILGDGLEGSSLLQLYQSNMSPGLFLSPGF